MTSRPGFLLLASLFLLSGAASGQLPDRSPSGILVDRVVPMAHLEDLDGGPDSPPADLARWRQVVFELARAADQPLAWPAVDEFRASSVRHEDPRLVPLAVVLARYDRIAGSNGLDGGLVFSLAPVRQQVYHGSEVRVVLDAAAVLTNTAAPVRWELEAGAGWQDLEPGKPLALSFAAVGRKNLTLRATLPDGTFLHARTFLDVVRLDTPQPHQTWPITATESYGGLVGTGQAYVYLAQGHQTLTNPVVVVEGYDLDNSMDWPVLYQMLNQQNLLEDLRAAGHDAVVLDFTEATDHIQRNAFVLTRLLQQVREAAGPEVPLTVVGASMGGLVSRYALTWLESQGLDLGVRTFISFDSPHNGANIPLGLQHWLDFFKDQAAEPQYLLSRLNTPASRQMLLYHYAAGASPGSDPLFDTLRNELMGLGDWPVLTRKVAVANGSGLGAGQGYPAGAQIIRYEYRSTLVDIDGNVWSVPDMQTQVIFDGMINLIWPLPDTYQTISVGGSAPWDSAPGGLRPTMAQMDTTAVPYGDIVALHDAHCFIPSVSALAIAGAGPFFDIAGAGDLAGLTPFDAVYWPQENQEHIAITPENKIWFMNEVLAAPSPVQDLPPVAGAPALTAVPNPFNPRTELAFELDRPGNVRLDIFDARGRLVRRLVRGEVLEAGRHEVVWDGRDSSGQTAAAGVYLARLRAGNVLDTRRMTLVK